MDQDTGGVRGTSTAPSNRGGTGDSGGRGILAAGGAGQLEHFYTTLDKNRQGVWERASVQRASGKGPRFHLDKFLDGRSNTLYLCAPADEQREFRPILTALTRTIVQRTFQVNRGFAGELLELLHGPMVAIHSSAGEATPLLMVLDDAGSVAPLSDLGSLAGTAAKVAIQLGEHLP